MRKRIPASVNSILDDFDPEARRRFQGQEDTDLSPRETLRRLPHMIRLITSLAFEADRSTAAGLVLAVTGSACCGVVALLSTQPLIRALFEAKGTADHLHQVLIALVVTTCATAGRASLDGVAAYLRAALLPGIEAIAEERLHIATLEVELTAFDDSRWHDSFYRARDYGTQYTARSFELLAQLLGWFARLMSAIVVVAILSAPLALVLVVTTLPEAWSALRAAHLSRLSRYSKAALRRRIKVISELFSKPESAAEIRVQTARPMLLHRFRRLAVAAEDEEKNFGLAHARAEAAGRTLGGIGLAVTYAVLGLLYYRSSLSPATAATAVLAVRSAHSMVRSSINQLGYFFESGGYVVDFHTFIQDSATRSYLTGETIPPPRGFSKLEIRDVTYTYPRADRPALHNLSTTIECGEVVALVGENGSGKTTLAKLLTGLYRPSHGVICWDGIDIADFEPQSMHEQIALVPQHPTRWPFTVRENIEIGRNDRTDPHGRYLLRVAHEANCDELIADLPFGYDTILSRKFKNGQDLSGGQWQRLSLARGLYRDAALTIFDEPTSALDPRAEAHILTDLAKLRSAGKTVVLITHRLAAARHCDRILVLHRGFLAEEGTHEELIHSGKHYAAMFEIQRKSYA